jgi:uncharacterized protein (TIGR03083 family)
VQGFHLDASPLNAVDVRLNSDAVIANLEIDRDAGNHQRMTQRNHVRSSLRRLDPSDTRNREDVALLYLAVDNCSDGFRLHLHVATRNRTTVSRFFRRDIDHSGVACSVEVGELWIAHAATTVPVEVRAVSLTLPLTLPLTLSSTAWGRPQIGTVRVMTELAPLSYDALDHIRVDGTELLRLISNADLSTSVSTCPGWRLGDLAHHVGGVWNFWASIVSEEITDRNDVRKVAAPTRPETDAELVASVFESHVRLCETLHAADLDQKVWTWTGSARPTAWVRRRMAQETLMHLWDAGAALGFEIDFPSDICADGIDEFLMWFAAADRCEGEMKVGGTVHLHCTDADLREGTGEWFIAAMKEPAATFTREHRKGDVAIRGRAQDILMWLWRRDNDGLEMIGDKVVARRFRAFSELD